MCAKPLTSCFRCATQDKHAELTRNNGSDCDLRSWLGQTDKHIYTVCLLPLLGMESVCQKGTCTATIKVDVTYLGLPRMLADRPS